MEKSPDFLPQKKKAREALMNRALILNEYSSEHKRIAAFLQHRTFLL